MEVVGLNRSIKDFGDALKRDPKTLRAWIDVSGLQKGANRPVVHVDNNDNDVSVAGATPGNLDVELDLLTTVSRKVQVFTTGQPNACCVAQAPTASPDTVTVSGPQSLVQTAIAAVEVDISDRRAVVQLTAPVKIEAPDRKPIASATVNPPQVAVEVKISPTTFESQVPLVLGGLGSPGWVGNPASGFVVTGLEVTPLVVDIQGDQGSLAGVIRITTDPVDVNGRTADFSATLTLGNLNVPSGIRVVTPGPYVVRVHIAPEVRPSPTAAPAPSPTP